MGLVLDFGCGSAKVAGAIGIDNVPLEGVDIVHDLKSYPYPFEDITAEHVHLNHVLEHFSFSDGTKILHEVYRILQPGGTLHIRVPHVFSIAGWADPTHKSSFVFISYEFMHRNSAKSYYRETESIWVISRVSARVTWFNWKSYRLRQFDDWLSMQIARVLNWLLQRENWPGGADLLVRAVPMFHVEIQWDFVRPHDG